MLVTEGAARTWDTTAGSSWSLQLYSFYDRTVQRGLGFLNEYLCCLPNIRWVKKNVLAISRLTFIRHLSYAHDSQSQDKKAIYRGHPPNPAMPSCSFRRWNPLTKETRCSKDSEETPTSNVVQWQWSHKLLCWNAWAAVSETLWEGLEVWSCRRRCHWLWDFKTHPIPSICSFCLLLVDQVVSSQLFLLPFLCSISVDSTLWNPQPHIKSFLFSCFLIVFSHRKQ